MNNNGNKIIGYDSKTGNPIYAHNNYNPGNVPNNSLNNQNNVFYGQHNNYNSQVNQSMFPGQNVQPNNGQYNSNMPSNIGLYNPNSNLNNNGNNFNNYQHNQSNSNARLSRKSSALKVGTICLILFVIIVVSLMAIFSGDGSSYYFPNEGYPAGNDPVPSSSRGRYQTSVVYDNRYYSQSISGTNDAKKLIVNDSVSQKKSCPSEIVTIEDELINKYNITAVNLCEMDYDYAKELVKVFDYIYSKYPEARKYLTNFSVMNVPISQDQFIAAFMPIFDFAYSNTSTQYPIVLKTQILLNTAYFLNIPNLKNSVDESSAVGHFPPNATIYSPVAHELGHYLSFIALMKHYNLSSIILYDYSNSTKIDNLLNDFKYGDYSLAMITAAYNKYKKEKGYDLSLDTWRATISLYAMAKDNNGNYIYDETIAESFHDVYLNGENAKDASKYIVAEVTERLR